VTDVLAAKSGVVLSKFDEVSVQLYPYNSTKMGTPVEIRLAKIILRLQLQIEKHESPQLHLLHSVLDTLRKKDTPVLAYTKILLHNVPLFTRLIREYNPDVQDSPFTIVLNILRVLCRVGNTGTSDVESRRESVSATLLDKPDWTEEEKITSFDSNTRVKLQAGIRERLLDSGLVRVVTEALLSSRSGHVHAVAVGFITDIAIDADACKDAVPQAFVRLASCPRRACKFTAITLLAGICADPASRLSLLQATGSPACRKWVIDSLPHLWRMLIDSKDGSLQASASEALVLLFTTLGTTEVGHSIAYGLGNIMTMGSDSDGRSILSSLRYVIEESDLHPETGPAAIPPVSETVEKAQAPQKGSSNWKTLKRTVTTKAVNAPSGSVLVGAHIIMRIVEETKACSAPTASLLSKFHDNELHKVCYLCLLRNNQALQQEQKNLEVLQDARSSGNSGDSFKLFEAQTVQEQIVRELTIQGERLLEALRCWLQEDEEAAWMTHMLLQQAGSELRDTGDTGESHSFYEGTDSGAPLRQPALAAVLAKSLGATLQLGLRRGAMKRLLDDASPLGVDSSGNNSISVYEPANLPRTPRFADNDVLAYSPAKQPSSGPSGALGYLLLKKMYENHGVSFPTVSAEQVGASAAPPPTVLSPRDGKALIRAVGAGSLPSTAVCGAAVSALNNACVILNSNPSALSDQEMTHILQRLGRQIVLTPAAAAKAVREKKISRGLKVQSASVDIASAEKSARKEIPLPKQPQPPPKESRPSGAGTRRNSAVAAATQVAAGKHTSRSPRVTPFSRVQGYSIAALHALSNGQGGISARAAQLKCAADNALSGDGDPLITDPGRGVRNLPDYHAPNNQTLDIYMHEMHQRIYPLERSSPHTQTIDVIDTSEKQPEQVYSDLPAKVGLKIKKIKIIRSESHKSD
jgi:hypothetical protein